MSILDFTNKTPTDILSSDRKFDSAWHTFQALCWLDYAKKNTNISALQYAALELRYAIEQFWFEYFVLTVGGVIDRNEYLKVKNNSTKLYKFLDKRTPDIKKLSSFSKIIYSLETNLPNITDWDLEKLKKIYGTVSDYLHFQGIPEETWDSSEWFVEFLSTIENGTKYLWDGFIKGETAFIRPKDMGNEVQQAWEDYKNGNINEADVIGRLKIAQPILQQRGQNFRKM